MLLHFFNLVLGCEKHRNVISLPCIYRNVNQNKQPVTKLSKLEIFNIIFEKNWTICYVFFIIIFVIFLLSSRLKQNIAGSKVRSFKIMIISYNTLAYF